MSDYYQQVEAAIQAIVFHSETTYSWLGMRSHPLSRAVKRTMTPKTARSYLLFNLQSQLYNYFYCQGKVTSTRWEGSNFAATVDMTNFTEELSAANSGSGCWEAGWEVIRSSDNELVVRKEGLDLWVRPEDCSAPHGSPIAEGLRLSLRLPKELLGMSPGYYMALGNESFTDNDPQGLVRVYWNIGADSAVQFIQLVTSVLNGARLPFRLKVVNDPSQFTRCDTAVIYIRKSDYPAVSGILANVYPEIFQGLRPGTPVFTKPLALGLGLAEDPGQGESFGLHRCQLLADGLIRGFEQNKTSVDERLKIVADRFNQEGISLEKPYLNPDSIDDYKFCMVHDLAR